VQDARFGGMALALIAIGISRKFLVKKQTSVRQSLADSILFIFSEETWKK
jgi:hypothetical protein